MEATLLEIGKLFGPGAMMIGALLYYINKRDDRASKEALNREERMGNRLDKVQDEYTQCRRNTIDKCNIMNERVLIALEKLTEATNRNTVAIENNFRPKRSTDANAA